MKSFKLDRLTFIVSIVLFFACSKVDDVVPVDDQTSILPDVGNEAENIPQWIYDEMSFFYFWDSGLPENEPTGSEDPEDYFYSLLNNSDKFSYISDDAEAIKEEISGTIIAMGFSPAYGVFTNNNNLFAVVEYVYPDSPANKAGLERGDIILKINGEDLNQSNFQELGSNEGFSVTLGNYNGRNIIPTDEIVTINTGVIELDPVIHYEVKDRNGIKVGYLVFVDFISGKNDKWLNSLDNALSEMKAEGITELILDLRYNPGGEVVVAEYLASSLAPPGVVSNNEVLVRYEYNDNLYDYFLSRQGENSPNLVSRFQPAKHNLNLSDIYVLTTGSTASASELVINGLRPYMNVTMIGEPTFGKFYGSYVLFDQNDPPKHNWAIAPVVLKYANANGVTDFVNGLQPDVFLQDDLLSARDFGDETDPMLSAALSLIAGDGISGAKTGTGRLYEPVYDLDRINRKNIFQSGLPAVE
ncbi:MAG: S41 family peptidase [Cytophagales bacterium]|nr:S41 family peptidase [Cytophagales bacterium]